jgi:hypothetical protein
MNSDPENQPDDPSFPDFVDALNSVNEQDPATARNKDSIADNNGRRIKLDDKTKQSTKTIRGVE